MQALPSNLGVVLRFVAEHDIGGRIPPHIENDRVVFEGSYTQRQADGSVTVGYEMLSAKTLREARAKLGY